jgi:nucleoside 2-deoxyribosyltransferase
MENELGTCPVCKLVLDTGKMGIEYAHSIYNVLCPRCGPFRITDEAMINLTNVKPVSDGFRLSAAIRKLALDGDEPPLLKTDNTEVLKNSVSSPKTPLDAMDAVLVALGKMGSDTKRDTNIAMNNDHTIACLPTQQSMAKVLDVLEDAEYIRRRNENSLRITANGYRRIDELRRSRIASNQAFVAMSFDDDLDAAYFGGTEPALKATGYNVVRLKELEHNDLIDSRLIVEIRRSDLLIADFTKQNRGAYFEAGFARGLGIHVIYTVQDKHLHGNKLKGKAHIEGVHFDVGHYNAVVWSDPDDLREKLEYRIREAIPGRAEKRAVTE